MNGRFLGNMKLRSKMLWGFVIVLIVTTAVSVFTYVTQAQRTETLAWVNHTNEVRLQIEQVLEGLVNMETGFRGYLITGEDKFLEPYTAGVQQVDAALSKLQELTADNPAQLARWTELATEHDRWITEWIDPAKDLRVLANQASQSQDALSAIIASGQGKAAMDAIRSNLALMEANLDVKNDYESIILVNKILLAMVNQETGMRGFIASGDEAILAPYTQGQQEFTTYTAALRRRLSSDTNNRLLLDQVETQATQWKTDMAEPWIAARRAVNANPTTVADVANYERTAGGKEMMDAMRSILAAATQAEETLLTERQKADEDAVAFSNAVIIFGSIAAILIGMLIAFFLSGAISESVSYMAKVAQAMALGDFGQAVELQQKDEVGVLADAFRRMRASMMAMMDQVNVLTEAAIAGRLDKRADPTKFEGDYRNLVTGVNTTLDAVIGPLNVAAEYVDRISKGDIPAKITDEYRGDFNEIKINLNMCIDALNGLIAEANMLTRAAVEGRLDTRGDVTKFHGAYAEIVRGVNRTLDAVIGPLNVTAEYLDRISKGDVPALITDAYQGDFNEIKNNLNMLITTLNEFISEMNRMSREQNAGDLDARIAIERFSGAYRQMAQGVVDQVFEHIRIKRAIVSVVGRYGEGDFTAVMERLPGKKAFIHEQLDVVRGNLQRLSDTVSGLAQAAVAGKLSTRADAAAFRGDWAKLVQGMNGTLDAVIGPLNVAAEYVNQIARGEIPAPITTQYAGDFGVLRDNLNILSARLREMIGSLQEAANNLATAAAQILAATTQQATGASEQSASITQTTTTVDEVKTISDQAIMRAQEVSDAARRTIEVSRSGRDAVAATIDSMTTIKGRVEGIAENILALSDQTQQIGEITTTVSDIAAQSNMLALNASVEAARAGEHGKGFAVVAMEVRSLAEQSKQATAQVRAILTDIQNAINASVMVTEEGTKVVDDGVRRAAQAREAIEQLSAVIAESAQVSAQVVAGGQQQASGVEQIALAIQNIHQAMQQSLASTRQAESAARNLNTLATTLTDTVKQYKVNGNGRK